MVQTLLTSPVTLRDLRQQVGLQPTATPNDFSKWRAERPIDFDLEMQKLARNQQGVSLLRKVYRFWQRPSSEPFTFVKLMGDRAPQYAVSCEFALRNPDNELYTVLQILKKLQR
ncbi:hypothetical protein [Vacuolonema iberomarrocanum]|uniref:hypothetical protein n=1 Tax=Vacuolonema iberomarrocanum TaxID=3454632 RepID=UPI0019EDA834|nr:hypothetical protein [filamentous cyanobacterium LEGE 07170]